MKRGTPQHPKMKAFARSLKIPLPHAVGIMEMLWQFAAEYAPDGGIGRLDDSEIADACGWPDKRSGELVEALVHCRWFTENSDCRLFVNDWPEHCEDSVHRKLARAHRWFADGSAPNIARLPKDARTEAQQFYSSAQSAHDVRNKCAPDAQKVPTDLRAFAFATPSHANAANAHAPDQSPDARAIAEAGERMYTIHPKKKDLPLLPGALYHALNGRPASEVLPQIESCHKAWCQTDDWQKSDGRFAPSLPTWIEDRGFTKWPNGTGPAPNKPLNLYEPPKPIPVPVEKRS